MPYFTQHIIAIVNNCQQIMELAQHMKQLYWPKSRTEHYEDFEKLVETFQVINSNRDMACVVNQGLHLMFFFLLPRICEMKLEFTC